MFQVLQFEISNSIFQIILFNTNDLLTAVWVHVSNNTNLL